MVWELQLSPLVFGVFSQVLNSDDWVLSVIVIAVFVQKLVIEVALVGIWLVRSVQIFPVEFREVLLVVMTGDFASLFSLFRSRVPISVSLGKLLNWEVIFSGPRKVIFFILWVSFSRSTPFGIRVGLRKRISFRGILSPNVLVARLFLGNVPLIVFFVHNQLLSLTDISS